MAISNTSILIKRSLSTGRPSALQAGEFAYSYASNTLFIGTPGGNGVVNVGGQYYTATLDAATNANTINTLVKRDASGSFYGRLYGNANTSTTLITARNFSVSGGDITASAQLFDGSTDVVLNAALNSVPGLTAGYYGGSTPSSSTIPVVQVAANGRIMSIANTTVTSSFNISDGTTSSQVQSGNTFFHLGTKGIVTAVSQNTVTFSTDNTVLRSNTTTVGPQVINTALTISNDLTVSGNLNVLGNSTTIHTSTYTVDDPLIYLAGNNTTSDVVNIGFAGDYFDGTTQRQTGLYRAADSKQFYLFDNYTPSLYSNNAIDRGNTSFHIATITANVTGANIQSSQIYNSTFTNGTISGLTSAIVVSDGGTGKTSFTNGQVVVGSGTGALQQLANVASINTSIANNYTVNNITTDVYGRVTNYTTQAIGGLTVPQGGTGQTTFTNGQLVVGSGTGALQQLANTNTAGTYGSSSYIPVLTTDVYGRVSSVANTQIAIDTSQIITGILPVVRGGTGINTATLNGMIFGNGTGAFQVTAVAGGSDQTWSNQIMTVNNSGTPTWSTALDGGQF